MQDISAFQRYVADMVLASDECLTAKRHVPALVLIYSLVDGMSWAGADLSSGDIRGRFESWVDRWVIPRLPVANPPITATDLYAARCAILHTGTGVSDLSKKGKAKRLMYAWGTATTEPLEYAISGSGLSNEHAALHYDALLAAVRHGVAYYFEAGEVDPVVAAQLERAASYHYANVPA
jgi:hypothetical protein